MRLKDSNGNEYMKFPQEYDPESVIKTVLFGQYASDRGQQYIDSGFKEAKEMLKNGTSAQETAESCGFKDYSTFYRLFKKSYGITPTECRRTGKKPKMIS